MNMYPKNDSQYQDTTIAAVKLEASGGWSIERADGWSFWIQAPSPITPAKGMKARFYGPGIGGTVRGLFLDGKQIYYRTIDEERKHQDNMLYGADARDWLARWDAGQMVWSITMGGFGPSYEQAIQISVAEILRHLLEKGYDAAQWETQSIWQRDRQLIEKVAFANDRIQQMSLSGMQFSAALQLAIYLFRYGPKKMMSDASMESRQIQVCRYFPSEPFGPSPVTARENGELVTGPIRAPLSPVRSSPAAAGKRKPRGQRTSAGCSATTHGAKKPGHFSP